MKRWFIITLIFPAFLAGASPADSLIAKAEKAYLQGDYPQSIESYKSVLRLGYHSAELYYNLGNACFKSNEIPSAILYYEKARKLQPQDDDIRFNLKLAQSRVIDKIEPVPELFLKVWWRDLRDLQTTDGWAWMTVAAFILFLAMAFGFIFSSGVRSRKLFFWSGIILIFLTAFFLVLGTQSYRGNTRDLEGIVFTPTVTVKSSPSENSTDLFVIHEGTKVSITDRLNEWSEIRIANGSVGWIMSNDFEPI